MLKNAFQRLVGGKTEIDTYTLLRLQAKTYRLVKNYVNPILSQHKLSTLDWSLLGLLKNNPKGCRFVDISNHMGVEPPFVTELVSSIKKAKLIKIEADPEDRRAKIIILTEKGIQLVKDLEVRVEERLDTILSDVSTSDFDGYVKMMNTLAEKLDAQNNENKK